MPIYSGGIFSKKLVPIHSEKFRRKMPKKWIPAKFAGIPIPSGIPQIFLSDFVPWHISYMINDLALPPKHGNRLTTVLF